MLFSSNFPLIYFAILSLYKIGLITRCQESSLYWMLPLTLPYLIIFLASCGMTKLYWFYTGSQSTLISHLEFLCNLKSWERLNFDPSSTYSPTGRWGLSFPQI